MQIKILVVDDEESLCEILKYNLELEGYEVDTAHSADEAFNLDLPSYSLIILDIMMPRVSGFDIAKRLKNSASTEYIPILFCSALNGEDDRVMGLNIGADDYIVKPFMVREVIARVRSILRRSAMSKILVNKISDGTFKPDIIYKNLRIDRNKKIVLVNTADVNLTKTEYQLLLFLISRRNSIQSRDDIMKNVWNKENVTYRTIDTTITRLRKKMGEYGHNITTRLGYGYGFQENI